MNGFFGSSKASISALIALLGGLRSDKNKSVRLKVRQSQLVNITTQVSSSSLLRLMVLTKRDGLRVTPVGG